MPRSRLRRSTRAGRPPRTASIVSTFKKAMAFERAFVKAGGLLGAGSDPCCISAIAGYGDQRNYELLIEAGFTPEEAVKIMTSNGAKILGFDKTRRHDSAGHAGRPRRSERRCRSRRRRTFVRRTSSFVAGSVSTRQNCASRSRDSSDCGSAQPDHSLHVHAS